ncbi:MAG: AmmeMemoRadiSam system radical SAM enzyme [Endomicrobium sp.]|jgi:pyruvate formate lyase activating enzyme|nr:AmmeMemoRadiSam system radical SAM enzyme [Endomicrobium sp.]
MQDKIALYWNKQGGKVFCELCPHECILVHGKFGICNARQNIKNVLISKSYGVISTINIDPIEKKPLYHFYPGSTTLSFGSFGCNLKCGFCQNYVIARAKPSENIKLSPEDAIYFAVEKNAKLLSYTYNEPLTNYEWVLELAKLAARKNMHNILVTNGYIKEAPLEKLADYIAAANIDLKAYDDGFYNRHCSGTLSQVLKSIEILYKLKVHIEITNLVIDAENSDRQHFLQMLNFISSLSDEIPLHLSRYFPNNNFVLPQTRKETLINLYKIAKNKLKHVYIGNYDDCKYGSTYCKNCGFCIIERNGYNIKINCKNPAFCPQCMTRTNIII